MTSDTAGGADQAPLAGSRRGVRARLEWALPFVPGFLLLTLLFLIPMAIMLIFSLWRTNSDFNIVTEWNLNNYVRFFSQGTYLRTFAKTLLMAFAVTAAGIGTRTAVHLFPRPLRRAGRPAGGPPGGHRPVLDQLPAPGLRLAGDPG